MRDRETRDGARWANHAELRSWNDLVAANPRGGHIWQSSEWGALKRQDGWRPAHVIYEDRGERIAALYLRRSFPGFGELWYCPKGPAVHDLGQLRRLMRHDSLFSPSFVVRVEPELTVAEMSTLRPQDRIVKAPLDVQVYLSTVIVDLRAPETELLGGFKAKTRYNIRLAERRGVRVERAAPTPEALDAMYDLIATTHERADFPGFRYRPASYFHRYWRLLSEAGLGQLLLARVEGEVVAGVFVTRMGRRGWYKDGGSYRKHTALMAPHLLQWEAMRWLREQGVEAYDMVGVPPADALREDHPLWGLWRFKSGFADQIVEYGGTFDVSLGARRYALWNVAGERAAHAYAQRVRTTLLY
ncbi:MAG: peptidoglycan bridge formation glycyltransferase FemA/FemB family protein [Candidatus Dormibacteria bacterium]